MRHRKLLASICLSGLAFFPFKSLATDVDRATYVADLHQTPLFVVLDQPKIEALYAGVSGPGYLPTSTQPLPWNAIATNALGGALGMAVIAAETKAQNHQFAEAHIATLRESSKDVDLQTGLQQAIVESFHGVAWLDGGTTAVVPDAKGVNPPQDCPAWVTVHTRYALSTDFSHIVLIADVELYRQMPGKTGDDWRHRPAFHNTLVYQSDALHLADKTDADVQRLIDEENAHWDQAAIDAEIVALNSTSAHDSTIAKRRRAVQNKIDQHRKKLVAAKSAKWDNDQLADQYARIWGEHDVVALKQALHDGGAEIGKMLAATFGHGGNTEQLAGSAKSTQGANAISTQTTGDEQRTDNVRPNGDVISVHGDDKLMIGPYTTDS